jgi:delta 1-pyrroline-5-carboxylate dehydrogenase
MALGVNLTLGVHACVDLNCCHLQQHARVSNAYINHNMIAAVMVLRPMAGKGFVRQILKHGEHVSYTVSPRTVLFLLPSPYPAAMRP